MCEFGHLLGRLCWFSVFSSETSRLLTVPSIYKDFLHSKILYNCGEQYLSEKRLEFVFRRSDLRLGPGSDQ